MRDVLVQFRADLQGARDGVTLLDQYKKLHELLHNLQVKFVQKIENAADEARAGKEGGPLDLYAYRAPRTPRPRPAQDCRDAANRARIRLGGDARSRRRPG